MKTKTCVMLLVKYPDEGAVKSRLTQQISQKVVVKLYTNFVLDILEMLKKSNTSLIILFHPPDSLTRFQRWLGRKYNYVPQIGLDLGERLKNGFISCFTRDFMNAIALASDVPDLSQNVIIEACSAFEYNDAVIGPSPDGGYYLIGFKRDTFTPTIFKEIPWSGNTVFKETIERLKNRGQKIHVLPVWRDIDTLKDLQIFTEKKHRTNNNGSNTLKYLLQNKEILNEVKNRDKN